MRQIFLRIALSILFIYSVNSVEAQAVISDPSFGASGVRTLNFPDQASDGVVYDNKMNINRTNDIWQFLSRDYSVNNPFTAAAYNTARFPTTISSLLPILWSSEFQFGAPMQIGYGCR